MGRLRFDDLQAERRYRKWSAYGQSKLANLLFALELDRRSHAVGSKLVSSAVHPGLADTPLQDGTPMSHFRRFMRPAPEAARQILYAATSPDVAGGELFGPPGLLRPRRPQRMSVARAGRDVKAPQRLWEVSEELTNVRSEFDAPVLS
jgi:NAD(P)-dependent dehydrogenase (short-subunit alcohol dehydrogenase family)